jgi:hypothetical protein
MSNNTLEVIKKHDKFIVAKNGQPVMPQSDGQQITTEFVSKEDAEKYMNILKALMNKKKHR